MEQEKIGKFIASCRKEKKLTQKELAEKLGVTEKSISNWENGRNMPDLSLFKPLCNELGISINELLSGNKLNENNYQKKLEENILNTINYTNKEQKATMLIIIGCLIILLSIFLNKNNLLFAVIGFVIFLVGLNKYKTNKIGNIKYFVLFILLLSIIDCINVINYEKPKFLYYKKTIDNMLVYKSLFYNFYIVNFNTKNEYYIVTSSTKQENEIPNVSFNRDKSGIDNIIKYKSKYVGDNSNTVNLINSLPLSEYGETVKIDSNNFGIIIYYNVADWYIDDFYLKKSLIYNSVSIFSLIDNLEYIVYNFSGMTYKITKNQIISYPNYELINESKENFNNYLESKTNNQEFINDIFIKYFK